MKYNLHIIVPTDLSSNGNLAFYHASEICKLFGGSMTPVYILPQQESWYHKSNTFEFEKEKAVIEMEWKRLLSKISISMACTQCINEPQILYGDVVEEILSVADDADLIVMTTKGHSGINRLILGSITSKVVNLSSKPVVVVDDASEIAPMERILVCTDLSEMSKVVFPYAATFAKRTGCILDLSYMIYTGPFQKKDTSEIVADSIKELENIKKEYFGPISEQVNVEALLTSVSIGEAITNLINSRKYQMVFISTLGNANLKNVFLGSVASSIIRLSNAAVFSINPRGG